MKGNVNPFEPWRPVEAQVPPPIHASRPWRPPPPPPARRAVEEPPFVEPVKPLPRNKPPEKSPRSAQPPCRTGQSSASGAPNWRWAAFILLSVLGLICLDSVGWVRSTHMPRLMALGASVGILTGMTLNPRRSWRNRLTWMAAALAFAGIALWFVPTVRGVSLWSAYRQIDELRVFPAGDLAGYQRGAAARRTLVEEFPSFLPDVTAAERGWFRRTVDEAIENADRQLENDPQTAFADLHRLNTELPRLEPTHYGSVQKELEAARLRAMQASAKVVQREVKQGRIEQP